MNDKEFNKKPESWYREEIAINADRLTFLCLISLFDLALRHPQITNNAKNIGIEFGKTVLMRLIDDGMFIPEPCMSSYKKTFEISD